MNFEGERYSSAWAHIALCADLTWTTEPPDDFIIANQRLWAQHCHISQILQASTLENLPSTSLSNQSESEKRQYTNTNYESSSYNGRLNVKDVIPESRLAQFYGNFYYDELRENCYTSENDSLNISNYRSNGYGNSDLTECWMLPEVEYWFRKLMDDSSEQRELLRRRRQYKMLVENDFERWGASAAGRAEASLAARVLSVRSLWQPAPAPTPTPPRTPRKMRARRRQPRRLAHAPPRHPPAPAPLACEPACKFQFDSPRRTQLNECKKALGSLSASIHAVMRASAARCPPYRGTNVSRYTPTSQRPIRCLDKKYGTHWPRNLVSPRLNNELHLNDVENMSKLVSSFKNHEDNNANDEKQNENSNNSNQQSAIDGKMSKESKGLEISEHCKVVQKERAVIDSEMPSTSSTPIDFGSRKKRLYSTVLSTQPINLATVRLPQKTIIPGLLKLNPKIVLPSARIRASNVDNKFEELEKEALEQYKASDESIDTKFSELEKQAVEQYNTSNSNTSCSSGNSAEKHTTLPSPPQTDKPNRKHQSKFHKDKTLDSVIIYSQNFPDLNAKGHSSMMNLKNFHTPPRGEKKEQTHRTNKNQRNFKMDTQRAASDTDYEARESKIHKGPMRWTLHVIPPKKRHLAVCASDTSDEDMEESTGSIKDAGPSVKKIDAKIKMSAHGGGDLHPIIRKTN